MTEHTEQVALFQWAEYAAHTDPRLHLMFAVPNGGHRHKAVAAKMKAEGVKPGVPDVFLDCPVGVYAGLRIEMKYGRNKPTQAQNEWIISLRNQGYRVEVCWGFEEARDVILRYLEGR